MPRLRTLAPRLTTLDTNAVRIPSKVANPHYNTPEHAAWRAAVLAQAGGRCVDCGRSDGRLFADHVVELQDGGAPFDVGNGAARCGSCHSRKTAAERARRMAQGAAQPVMRPGWLTPARIPTTIVCGPPASGKSRWVAAHAGSLDLLVDLDVIASGLARSTLHCWPRSLLGEAVAQRNRLLRDIGSPRPRWPAAWVILTEPEARHRAWWAATLRPGQIVVMETPDDECWRRIAADPERAPVRAEHSEAVAKWWATYDRRSGEVIVEGPRHAAPAKA